MLAGALAGATRGTVARTRPIPWPVREPASCEARPSTLDPRSRRTDRLLAMDRKADPHSPRSTALPVQGQRQTDLLRRAGHSLDRKPTARRKNDKVSLFKRGDVWWSYFYKDGVRHQSSTGASNRRQAETIEAKLKEEVNNRRFQIVEVDPNMTFGELAARFIASGSVRPHHIYHLKFLLPYFSETPVLWLTKSFADDFRRARKAQNPSIKDATINRDLSVLRHILYWAMDEQLLAANPLARMKMARERRTRRQVLSVAEELLLLSAAKDHLRAMMMAALDTGMRRGEITSQRWEDIDFSRQLLFVTRSKTPEGESREIPLTDRLHE